MAKQSNPLNTRENQGVETPMPDFLKKGSGLGNENVSSKDLVIPRLAIVQSQSPELDADNAEKFIVGAKIGQLFNTLTREAFDTVLLVDCFFRKEFTVFVKRTAGGGFRGAYPTQNEAVKFIESQEKPGELEVQETALHFCLVVDPNTLEPLAELVVPCTSTKLKVSRTWNSMIRMRSGDGGDRFSGCWSLGTQKQKNDKGTFYNFTVAPGPWVTEALYQRAKLTYEAVSTGLRDVDRTTDDGEIPETNTDAPKF